MQLNRLLMFVFDRPIKRNLKNYISSNSNKTTLTRMKNITGYVYRSIFGSYCLNKSYDVVIGIFTCLKHDLLFKLHSTFIL